ncbi:CSS-motif domain-containing protein [Citrobacter portucalensis]|uniref:CSS-motif domain-containing protein n=1 Tax=Citrobacter portucalensis TaxID=1639133 RepID=UPI003908ACF6
MRHIRLVRPNKFILDEARSAAGRAHSLLSQPCNSQTRTELDRLAIGIEHVRVINLFKNNNLVCSSWNGTLGMRKHILAGPENTVALRIDEPFSQGEAKLIRVAANAHAI